MKNSWCQEPFSLSGCFLISCTLITFLLGIPSTGEAQKHYTAEVSYAIKLGRTKPLYDYISVGATDSLKRREYKANKPVTVPNFAGRRHLDFHRADALPQGKDPLFNPNPDRTIEYEILPKINIQGINMNAANSSVPDPNGDVSHDYYLEIVNATHFRVYDKGGQAVSSLISANSIWSQVQQSSAGDPIILYDQQADRWFLTEFPFNNRVLLAVSVTNDPRGAWDAYAFQTPRFPDFPKYGIWHDAFYLTTNEGGNNFPIYAFNREDLLAGIDTIQFQRLTVPKHGGVFFEVGQPVDWDGNTPPPPGSPGMVVKIHDDDWFTTDQDHIILHNIHIDWDSAHNSNIELVEIPTAPFDTDGCSLENTGGFSCVPQPNNQGIDGAEWIITNKSQYRNFGTHESVVLSFMVDVTGEEVAGIRWMELRRTPTQDWHLYQEGTVGSDDGLHRFMSSIGIDGEGNIGLAYSVSGFEKHPSLRYTGRYATDELGQMTFKEYEFGTGAGSMGTDRYGDYASMSVDPTDDRTFWFTGQYVPSNNNWSTRIVAFSARRDSIDILPLSLVSPVSAPGLTNEPLTIRVINRGVTTIYDFQVAYQFAGGSWIVEDALIDSLEVDSVYIHTFQSSVSFGAPGLYAISVATILAPDENPLNDTLDLQIRKIALRDIALQFDASTSQDVICDESGVSQIILKNLGADDINTILLQISNEGVPVDTVLWFGTLAPAEEELYSLHITALTPGENEITVDVLEVNNQNDEIPGNNEITWTVTAVPDGEGLTLQLLTDNFPQETTWKLLDAADEVIATGGPYTDPQNLYTASFCLDVDACYTFIISDAFGDGMSAQGVMGDFEILNQDNEVIASLSKPNFGRNDTTEFCLNGACMLDINIGVSHESIPGANDGVAIVDVSNSVGNLSFSINGGANFQSENSFFNLAPGAYQLIVIDDASCSDTLLFEVSTCQLQTLVTTIPAVGGDVGEIHISTIGNFGTLMYSINGSAFGIDSFFNMLEPGDYIVVTRDEFGCSQTDSVTVSTQVSTTHVNDGSFIRLFPNPGRGVYQVEGHLVTNEIFINYTIFTIAGDPVQYGSIPRYNDVFKGEFSLLAYPSGQYFMVFEHGDRRIIKRIIKTD